MGEGYRCTLEHAAETFESRSGAVAFEEVHPDPGVIPPGKGTDSVTFAELDERSNRIANGLREFGVGDGDVVSFQVPNWIEFPLLYLGVLKAGAVCHPILPDHRSHEVGFMVDLCGSDVLVVPSRFRGFDHVAMAHDLIESGRIDPRHVFVIGGFDPPDERFVPFPDLETADASTPDHEQDPDDLAQIMFTSGTTGEPKGARQTEAVGAMQIMPPNEEVLGLTAEDVTFAPSPLAHNTGFQYLMRLPMLVGARTVLFDKWQPRGALETLAEEGCTFSWGATIFLKDLLDAAEGTDRTLPDLRMFKLGGAPIPRRVVERAYERFENITVLAGWGQTENGIVTVTRPDDPIERIATTDGRVLPGREVTVRAEYDGEAVRNEVGKLLMRGPSLFEGYHRRPGLTDEAFTDDGWFKTGDLAVMDDDGYISIEGREKDVIVRGGENIPAPEVEELVLEHPDVADVAVVAMPDERLGERPCAYVRLEPGSDGLSVEELSAFLSETGVQIHKHPERVEVVGEFPRTSTGKVEKYRLREDVAGKLGSDPV